MANETAAKVDEALDVLSGAILDWRNKVCDQTFAAMQSAIDEFAEATRLDERAKCCADVCGLCGNGETPEYQEDAEAFFHEREEGRFLEFCDANPTHLRAAEEAKGQS